MRVLLDEQLPRQLAPLVVSAEPGEATGLVVLCGASNALEDLLPLVPGTLEAIKAVRPGQVFRVGA